jgi:hypothetical protein
MKPGGFKLWVVSYSTFQVVQPPPLPPVDVLLPVLVRPLLLRQLAIGLAPPRRVPRRRRRRFLSLPRRRHLRAALPLCSAAGCV